MGFVVWARPRFLVVLFFLRRNANLAGGFAGRLVLVGCCFCVCCDMPSIVILANCAEYRLFHRLCIYQDRATEHLRPNQRKKKNGASSSGGRARAFVHRFWGVMPGLKMSQGEQSGGPVPMLIHQPGNH